MAECGKSCVGREKVKDGACYLENERLCVNSKLFSFGFQAGWASEPWRQPRKETGMLS